MEFKMHSGELLMIYYPEMRYENIQKKIEDEEGINLKNTFWITKDNISNKLEVEEGGFCFKIGVLENGYYHLDKEVFATENDFYFSTEIEINQKFLWHIVIFL